MTLKRVVTDDETYDALAKAFGGTVHGWPCIPRTKPGMLQFRLRALEARINDALATVGHGPITDEMRGLYWGEARKGQDIHEDAGGYCWRCWQAALSLPYRTATMTYSGYMAPPGHGMDGEP